MRRRARVSRGRTRWGATTTGCAAGPECSTLRAQAPCLFGYPALTASLTRAVISRFRTSVWMTSGPGQIGCQDVVLGVEAGAQRGEVGMGGVDAVQEQQGFAGSGAVPT